MWISKKNENSFREKDCQSKTSPRSQTVDESVTFSFPKTARLLSKSHYQRVCRSGNKFFGEFVVIDYFLGSSLCPKLGITVSRRFGKAHTRNRFKRVVREAFRLNFSSLPKNLEINVLPRKSAPPSLLCITKDLHALLEKIHGPS